MELSGPNIKKFLEMELFYISGNGNPEKISSISGNGTFLYFRKRKTPQNSLYFRKRNFLLYQEDHPKPQKLKFLMFFQKSYEQSFLKAI